MQNLAEKLDFIWNWLGEINPDPNLYDFRSYKPGLSYRQIKTLTKKLPIQLPEEIYQLYSWKNGLDDNAYLNNHLNDYF